MKHHSTKTLFEHMLISVHGIEGKGHFPLVSIRHLQMPDNLALLENHNNIINHNNVQQYFNQRGCCSTLMLPASNAYTKKKA